MTDDTTAILRRLDAVERSQTDQASSISAIVNESNRLERLLESRTPSEDTMKWLTGLRDQEVETLEALGQMGEEQRALLFDAIDLTKSIRRTGRAAKWLLVGLLGIFVFTNMLSEQILKFWNLIQGAPR
ncbi:hypothetical protein [Aureimonas sp. ME7]|uniref:hypothetical protein n=1 Tax=Aureimonas sp. ME7 TaxID=2744252 RepID=UPI0015FAFE61|nr:hypothetical protein [Aureimonas sp. ME7]